MKTGARGNGLVGRVASRCCRLLVVVCMGLGVSTAFAQVSPVYQTGISKRGSAAESIIPKVHVCASHGGVITGAQKDLSLHAVTHKGECGGKVKTLSPRQTHELRKEMIGPAD